jgi:hypothetical protein
MSIRFHSVTLLGEERKGSWVHTSYDVAEALVHEFDEQSVDDATRIACRRTRRVVAAIGACIGLLIAFAAPKDGVWPWVLLPAGGAIGGLLVSMGSVRSVKLDNIAETARRARGFTGKFVTVNEEDWDAFLAGLEANRLKRFP